jgi:hypothetical protein
VERLKRSLHVLDEKMVAPCACSSQLKRVSALCVEGQRPILGSEATEDRLTVFPVPVAKWSDGTPDTTNDH